MIILKNRIKRLFSLLCATVLFLQIPFSANYINANAQYYNCPISLNSQAQNISYSYANVHKEIYGDSVMGRDLEAYVIDGLGYNNRTILCTFAVHGFEDWSYRDGQYLTQAANQVIEYLANNPYMLRDCRIVIVPCANPDGAIDGNNNSRSGRDAFGRCTANNVDINRDFIDFNGQETVGIRNLMWEYNPYIYLDFHGWYNEVLGDDFLVDAFRATNNLSKNKSGVFGYNKGYGIGYAKSQIGSYSALVELKSPDSVDYVAIANGIAKSIDYLPMVANKWGINRYGWCYVDSYGNISTSKWIMDSYDWCYVDYNGLMISNAWQTDYAGWCYVDDNGHLVRNNWIWHPCGWCYVDGEGHSIYNCWREVNNDWYAFDNDGYMYSNRWIMDSANWCYVGNDGSMIKNAWAKDYKSWCVVDSDGHLITNEWAEKDGKRHYMDNEGHITTGWLVLDENKYYFDDDGNMMLGRQVIDGVEYDFGIDGIVKTIQNDEPLSQEPEDLQHTSLDN